MITSSETENPPDLGPKVKVIPLWKPDDPLSILRIVFEVLKLKPDIVHYNLHLAVFGRSRLANIVGLSLPFLTRLLGFRVVTTLHNLPEAIRTEVVGLEKNLINRIGLTLGAKLASSAHALVVLMRSYSRIAPLRYNRRTVYIPHGAWFAGNCTPLDPGAARGYILFIGHIGPHKDIEMLIRAYRRVRRVLPDPPMLYIAGAPHPNLPEAAEVLRNLEVEGVRYLGYVEDREIPILVSGASLIVLPYKTCTGTSGVVHLVAAFGKPIVASDLPEFRELKAEGAGIAIVPHDEEHFADKIVELLRDPRAAEELGERNREFAEKRRWSTVADSYVRLYLDVVARALSPGN